MIFSCREIMASAPVFQEANSPISAVAKSMFEHNLALIPIVENSGNMKLVGTITLQDIARATAFGRNPQKTPALEIMTPDPVTCHPDDDINHAFKLMDKCLVSYVPIVDAEKRLLGVLSQDDIGICTCTMSKLTSL